MDKELLAGFMRQYFSLFSGELRFVWHGGEPLLAGIEFYEEVLRLQREFAKLGDNIENMIQTNATLINDEWADFFKRQAFRVGVSIDGRRENHDRQRLDAGGKGSFDKVMAGVATLCRHGITPGVIQTITRSSATSIAEDMKFFADELGISGWALNLFMDGSSPSGSCPCEGLRDEDVDLIYGVAIAEWIKRDDADLCLREIENIMAGVVGRRAKSCSFNGTCANYFCLDSGGKIWPCDRLSSDPAFLLGDLRKQNLQEVLEGELAASHAVRSRQLADDCVSCRWRSACNNGCTAMRDPRTNKYVYCDSRRNAFAKVEALLYGSSNTVDGPEKRGAVS